MGYVPGLPTLCILNGNLCMKIPFLKYKVTGEVDNTLVYPIKYVATVMVPQNVVASFEDLALQSAFARVNFSTPVGTFRHEKIKNLDKTAYKEKRSELYAQYDKIVNFLITDSVYSIEDERVFKTMFNTLLEPSLQPFYKVIDPEFYNKYISK